MLERLLNPWGAVMIAPLPKLWLVHVEAGALQTLLIYAFIVGVAYALQARDRLVSQDVKASPLNEKRTHAKALTCKMFILSLALALATTPTLAERSTAEEPTQPLAGYWRRCQRSSTLRQPKTISTQMR